jgi:hypothetical protein
MWLSIPTDQIYRVQLIQGAAEMNYFVSTAKLTTTHIYRAINLFVWLISHQPTVLFSQNKPATSNQPPVLFSQNKSAPATSQTDRLTKLLE